ASIRPKLASAAPRGGCRNADRSVRRGVSTRSLKPERAQWRATVRACVRARSCFAPLVFRVGGLRAPPQKTRDMFDFDGRALMTCRMSDVQQATAVGGNDALAACRASGCDLVSHHRTGDVGMLQRKRAA